MKLLVLLSAHLTIGATLAFAPSSMSQRHLTTLRASPNIEETSMESEPETEMDTETTYSILSEPDPNSVATAVSATTTIEINGWSADASKPCYGLPGAIAPTGYFDPLGFCQPGISLNDVKRYREAEVQHGRVAMLATVGYLSAELISGGGPFAITGPANDHLQQVPLPALLFLAADIAFVELKRATIGWVEPKYEPGSRTLWTLRDNYYPGDIGFDPLGLKPSDPSKFADMQTRELQNGRLAMLGWAGMCSQELVNHKTIMATIDFYQKVYSGINPYETY